jgi:hypothetical protein
MNDSPDMRQLLLAYVLQELSSEDRRIVDERLLAEQDFSDQLQEAEYDLIDDYHAGLLEAAFSPHRLAQSLSPTLQRGVVSPSSSTGQYPSRSRWFLRWSLAAATLTICIACGWFLVLHLHTTQRPQTAQEAVPPTHSGQPSRSHPPEGEATAVLLLASEVTRGPAGPTLELHPFTRVIEVEWLAPDERSPQSFALSVSVEGRILTKVKQDGPLKEVDGKRAAIFHLAPSVFTDNSADSHFLFMIGTDEVSQSVPAEFAVSVLRQ